MNRANPFRRGLAVLRSGPGQPTLPMLGSRPLYQYWALLKPHFRSILLPPQSLADGAHTQWSWREPVDSPPLTAAELATVRKRLAGAQRALTDAVEDVPESAADSLPAASILPQLQAHLDTAVRTLLAHSDATLARFVVRSDQGLLLHSWGLAVALPPHFPDATDCEIAGTVLVRHQPAAGREVVLDTPDGDNPARTTSDTAGRFRFPRISPGHYRVRVESALEQFPPAGVPVEIDRASVSGLELRDCGAEPNAGPVSAPPNRRRWVSIIVTCMLAFGLAAIGWWRSTSPGATPVATASAPGGANVASGIFAPARTDPRDNAPPPTPRPAIVEKNSAPSPLTRPPAGNDPARKSTQPSAVAVERHESGLGPDASVGSASASAPPGAASKTPANQNAAGAISSAAGPAVSVSGSSAAAADTGSTRRAASSATSPPGSASVATATASAASPPPTRQAAPPPAPHPTPPQKSSRTASTPSGSASAPDASRAPSTAVSSPPDSATANAPAVATARSESSSERTPSPDASDSPQSDRPAHPSTTTDPAVIVASNAATNDSTDSPPHSAPAAAPIENIRPESVILGPGLDVTARMRIRVSPWQLRLLQDAILPTVPTPVGHEDALEVLRDRLLRERQTQIPRSIAHPSIWIGFAIEFPAATRPPAGLHWRDRDGSAAAHATVIAGRAELSWPGPPPPDADCMLVDPNGQVFARAAVDERGNVVLLTLAGMRSWPWIALERSPVDDRPAPARAWATRFEWRVLGGAPAAPTWRRDDQWLGGQGHRLDLMPGKGETGPRRHALALVDRATGWALVSQIEISHEPPPAPAVRDR